MKNKFVIALLLSASLLMSACGVSSVDGNTDSESLSYTSSSSATGENNSAETEEANNSNSVSSSSSVENTASVASDNGAEKPNDNTDADEMRTEVSGSTVADILGGDESAATESAVSSASSESLSDAEASDSLTPATITTYDILDFSSVFSKADAKEALIDDASVITLNRDSIESENESVSVEGDVATITAAGTYVLEGTLSDGQIIIDAGENDKVYLLLNGVQINNSDGPCIFVRQADKTIVTLADGTKNILSDSGEEYIQPDDGSSVDGVIFSREDLTINGNGILSVEAEYKHGIVCKDDLTFISGTIAVNAAGKGVVGEDSVQIKDGVFTIESADDAIHSSTEDKEEKGYIYIEGGDFVIDTSEDGIHAATACVISGGNILIRNSKEGIEGATITVTGGDIDVTASDDGINAAYSSGNTSLNNNMPPFDRTNMPADSSFISDEYADYNDARQNFAERMTPPDDGTMPPEIPNEEFGDGDFPAMPNDSTTPRENDAHKKMMQTEGGMNTGKYVHGQLQRGMRGGFGMMDAQEDACLTITGGNIKVNAGGDGLDSNGYIYIDGGSIVVEGPENNGNGSLDYGISAEISGGTVLSVGSVGMAETFSKDSKQLSLFVNFEKVMPSGSSLKICDENGRVLYEYVASKSFQNVIFSSPELTDGCTYTISTDDDSVVIEA